MSDVENITKAMSYIFDDVKKTSNLKLSTLRQESHQVRDQFKESMDNQLWTYSQGQCVIILSSVASLNAMMKTVKRSFRTS